MELRSTLRLALALAALSTSAAAQSSWEGLTLFHPIGGTTTYLIDNAGTVVHTWASTVSHQSVYLLEDERLVRTIRGMGPNAEPGVQIVTWDGTVEWDFRYDLVHHDVEMLPNGNILMIARESKTPQEAIAAGRNPLTLSGTTFQPEIIIEVQPTGPTTGSIVWEWHIWDHLVQDFDVGASNFGVVADHPELMDVNYPPGMVGQSGDWNHANAIAYNAELDQIILNAHHQNEFWVIDHSTTTAEAAGHTGGTSGKGGDILYRWGNPEAYDAGTTADRQLFGQHNTQWIEDGSPGAGNILIFNNGNGRPQGDFSSLDELVLPPVDASGNYALTPGSAFGPAAPVWTYQAAIPTNFYSAIISGVQRLPNGNTLACSGTQAWFFEVTPAGDIVWEYQNNFPASGNQNVFRARRYRICEDPVNYCVTAPNSMGSGALIDWTGTASVSANDLTLQVSAASATQPGIFYFGDTQPQAPFGDGFRCAGGNVHRLQVVFTDASGNAMHALDLTSGQLPTVIDSGDTWNFQYWFRDPTFGGNGFNLSDGLEVLFCN
jgi:hypothetical protein